MDVDTALGIVNDASLAAYRDFVRETLFGTLGEYEFGFDARYDRIALAHAFVAVELALEPDCYVIVPVSREEAER